MKQILLFIVFLVTFANTATAQIKHRSEGSRTEQTEAAVSDTSVVQVVYMKNGDRFTGRVLAMNSQTIQLQLLNTGAVMTINMVDVRRMEVVETKNASLNGYNEHRGCDALTLSATAFSLPKGRGSYQNTWLFTNSFMYGVNDNVTIGGSLSGLIPSVQAKIAGKVGKNTLLGLSAFGFVVPLPIGTNNGGRNNPNNSNFYFPTGGGVNGILTVGTPKMFANFTAGIIGTDLVPTNTGVDGFFSFGGGIQLSRGFALTSDNFYLPTAIGYSAFTSGNLNDRGLFVPNLGARWINEKTQWDLSFTVLYFVPIPLLSFKTFFGR